MDKAVISTKKLSKYYGKTRGIHKLNITINEGEVFGFLGPNGAGKTTTIRTLLDFIRPTNGKAQIFDLDSHSSSVKIKNYIGYLPGDLSAYQNLTGQQFLKYMANLRNQVDFKYVKKLARDFKCNLNIKINKLSHGNKQKISIINAFMHKPKLLILDEPTTGLDPLMQQQFYELVNNARKEKRTVFISSHNLPEVQRICDRVAFIRAGKLIDTKEISELAKWSLHRLEIHFKSIPNKSVFWSVSGIEHLNIAGKIAHVTVKGSLTPLLKAISRYEVIDLITHELDLEDVFFNYYEKGKNVV
ncbi:MAG: ABC transporter ATP-binding protein [bacterium]|nr:ABC transporter ATP-binding protein [bacterium]